MARKQTRRQHNLSTKVAAAKAVLAGVSHREVAERYGVVQSMVSRWANNYQETGSVEKKRGPTGTGTGKGKGKARANGVDEIEARALTPQALFTSRVNRATVLLRQAWQEVKRMEGQRKIKGPDKAHSYAYMALLELQGDNGS